MSTTDEALAALAMLRAAATGDAEGLAFLETSLSQHERDAVNRVLLMWQVEMLDAGSGGNAVALIDARCRQLVASAAEPDGDEP